MKVHSVKSAWYNAETETNAKSFSSDSDGNPAIGKYDDASGKGTGYPRQFEYDKAVGAYPQAAVPRG
jgi:hypothetical protein